jgi:predicted ATPase
MRQNLPEGTVTFLFTDIEGSTSLLHELGSERYGELLSQHHRVCRVAWAAHGGVEVDTAGDAFFVAFPTASTALDAAADAQLAMAELGLRVRMGVHTGEVSVNETGYISLEVHRAARIAAAAHGGQVVVSRSTAALVGTNGLVDLGEHRFKDLAAPERVYQLGDADFPRLKSLYLSNLPVPATPFLGRERELADVVALLRDDTVRLLTLSGPGGTGKTRLALQSAAEAADGFAGGVWWVPLAPVRDSSLALPTIAQALEVRERPGRSLADDVRSALAGKKLLVLLDNAEHLLPELADDVASLAAVDGLKLLVTSRERLQLQPEHLFDVPALATEDAVELFLARASAHGARVERSTEVEELCRRLEELPLAIELAAARMRIFSVEQLGDRLGQSLDLLRGGRDADPRQRTLRATIQWSYDLLDPFDQRLLRAMSVFAGGCTFEAAERVCAADADLLESLIDKSLVRVRIDDAGRTRYWLLETVREYAAEQLDLMAETVTLRSRHAAWVVELVNELASDLRRLEPGAVARMQPEHDNIRAALRWSIEGGELGVGTLVVARLCVYWIVKGLGTEGARYADRLLDRAEGLSPAERLETIVGASELYRFTGDFQRGITLKEEGLALLPQLDDEIVLGPVPFPRDRLSIAFLKDLAQTYVMVGNLDAAHERADEALRRAIELGEPSVRAHCLVAKAVVEFAAGRFATARALFGEAAPTWEAGMHLAEIAMTHTMLGECHRREDELDEAHRELGLGLDVAAESGDLATLYELLQEHAGLAVARRQPEAAARLLGASHRLRDELGAPVWDPEDVTRMTSAIEDAIGGPALRALRSKGASLTLEDAVDLARSID